jgi:hypothetical protein
MCRPQFQAPRRIRGDSFSRETVQPILLALAHSNT